MRLIFFILIAVGMLAGYAWSRSVLDSHPVKAVNIAWYTASIGVVLFVWLVA